MKTVSLFVSVLPFCHFPYAKGCVHSAAHKPSELKGSCSKNGSSQRESSARQLFDSNHCTATWALVPTQERVRSQHLDQAGGQVTAFTAVVQFEAQPKWPYHHNLQNYKVWDTNAVLSLIYSEFDALEEQLAPEEDNKEVQSDFRHFCTVLQ